MSVAPRKPMTREEFFDWACSPIRGRERLLPDPVVVFEVLSPST